MNFKSQPKRPSELLSLARSFMPSRIMLTAFELGLFDCLSKGRRRAGKIAADLETDIRATEILLDALVSLDVLTKHGECYELGEEARKLLVPGEPHYIGDDLGHVCGLWEPWSNLTQVLRTGRSPVRRSKPETRLNLTLAMKRQAKSAAPRIAALLDGEKINTMLDLGGGSGQYAIALAQRCPRLRTVLCDLADQALKLAKADVEDAGLEDRINIRKANFFTEDIGSDYDLVFISSILCTLSEEKILLLLKKVKQSLKGGGRVVIRDYMLDETKTAPSTAALFSVCMLAATPEGRVYSSDELRNWLGDLEFEDVHRIPMPPMSLMIGTRGRHG